MKLTYDYPNNIAYLRFVGDDDRGPQVKTIEVSEDLNVDVAQDGKLVGIEFLNARQQISQRLILRNEATGRTIEIGLP